MVVVKISDSMGVFIRRGGYYILFVFKGGGGVFIRTGT